MKWHRRPILLRSPSSNRREPLLKPRPSLLEVSPRSSAGYTIPRTRMHHGKITRAHVAEAVGSTTAECAAICCCCPCVIVNLVVLVAYRVPASLCRKAWQRKRRRRRQLIKKGMTSPTKGRSEDGKETMMGSAMRKEEVAVIAEGLEKEMWDSFCNTGFWRSPSQSEHQKKIEDQHQNQTQQQPI